jgi:hypothetical protein
MLILFTTAVLGLVLGAGTVAFFRGTAAGAIACLVVMVLVALASVPVLGGGLLMVFMYLSAPLALVAFAGLAGAHFARTGSYVLAVLAVLPALAWIVALNIGEYQKQAGKAGAAAFVRADPRLMAMARPGMKPDVDSYSPGGDTHSDRYEILLDLERQPSTAIVYGERPDGRLVYRLACVSRGRPSGGERTTRECANAIELPPAPARR